MNSPVSSMSEVAPRTVATVAGRIVSVQVEPRDAAPRLTIRVDDGSGSIEAIFMGRREIPGIEPGVSIQLHGRVCNTDPFRRIYNPSFELG